MLIPQRTTWFSYWGIWGWCFGKICHWSLQNTRIWWFSSQEFWANIGHPFEDGANWLKSAWRNKKGFWIRLVDPPQSCWSNTRELEISFCPCKLFRTHFAVLRASKCEAFLVASSSLFLSGWVSLYHSFHQSIDEPISSWRNNTIQQNYVLLKQNSGNYVYICLFNCWMSGVA